MKGQQQGLLTRLQPLSLAPFFGIWFIGHEQDILIRNLWMGAVKNTVWAPLLSYFPYLRRSTNFIFDVGGTCPRVCITRCFSLSRAVWSIIAIKSESQEYVRIAIVQCYLFGNVRFWWRKLTIHESCQHMLQSNPGAGNATCGAGCPSLSSAVQPVQLCKHGRLFIRFSYTCTCKWGWCCWVYANGLWCFCVWREAAISFINDCMRAAENDLRHHERGRSPHMHPDKWQTVLEASPRIVIL